MTDLIKETLELVDDLYPPTDGAVRLREMLREASLAPETELPFYVAQLSLLISLLENLTDAKTLDEMRGHTFRAQVALEVTTGLLRYGFNVTAEEATN